MRLSARKTRVLLPLLILLIIIPFLLFKLNFFESMSKPKAGSCMILEEKYCKTVKFIANPNHPTSKIAVFDLPSGTLIFAPINGYYSNTPTFFYKNSNSGKYTTYPGSTITVSIDQNVKSASVIYNFVYFKELENVHQDKLKKGEAIATISDRKIDFLGNYNLVFSATDQKIEAGQTKYFPQDLNTLFKINE